MRPVAVAALSTGQAVRRVLYIALAANATVAVAKIVYGRLADFLAIEADGYHSLTDGLSSVVALVGVGLALRPPDAGHPYGHRKYEILAASVIGLSLVLLAARIGGDVLEHVRSGTAHAPRIGWQTFVVLGSTLLVNLGVSIYQARESRRLRSEVLRSDALHSRADCFVTGGVLVTAVLGWLGIPHLDLPAAAAVAVLIGKAGADILRENARYLTDSAVVEPERVRSLVTSIPPVAAAHTIRTRGTPDAVYMDLRIQVPGTLSVAETSRLTRILTDAIRHEFDSVVDVTIHPEPLEEHHEAREAASLQRA